VTSSGEPVPRVSRALIAEALLLAGILAIAAWLRLAGLDRTSLFGDEAVYSGQAAALAGDPAAIANFGIFLAHPLLFQLLLSAGFVGGFPAEGGRVLTALVGIGSVAIAWAIGRLVGGRVLGLSAAAILAVLAYDAYLSRLVLLDGPAAFLIGSALVAFVRAARQHSGTWLSVSAGVLGLAVLTKETSLFLLPAVVVTVALDSRLRMGLRAWLFAAATFAAVVAAYPISILAGGGLESTLTYLRYQVGRHDQSSPLTYLHLVDPYIGWPLVGCVAVGLVMAVWRGGDRRIVAIWAVVPSVILQAWGLRELQLPMLVVIQTTVLAAIGIDSIAHAVSSGLARRVGRIAARPAIAVAVSAGLLAGLASTIVPLSLRATSLPGGQPTRSGLGEASTWLRDHADPGAGIFVSTAYKSSVVAFYSGHPAYGFAAARRRDPVYRDPGDVEALWRAGGVGWVVLDRQSLDATSPASDGSAPYERVARLLAAHPHELAYVVPGDQPDRWLAQVYRLIPDDPARPRARAADIVGRGNTRAVDVSYAVCLAIGAGVVLFAHRTGRRRSRPRPDRTAEPN
jgi:4-amino-4-deoxy-L-arabinose transferase-like glycosyltransferase